MGTRKTRYEHQSRGLSLDGPQLGSWGLGHGHLGLKPSLDRSGHDPCRPGQNLCGGLAQVFGIQARVLGFRTQPLWTRAWVHEH